MERKGNNEKQTYNEESNNRKDKTKKKTQQ